MVGNFLGIIIDRALDDRIFPEELPDVDLRRVRFIPFTVST